MGKYSPENQFMRVRGIDTRYWEEGKNGLPVVLVHGLGGLMENWEHNVESLSGSRRVYAVDLAGFGLTEKPSAPYSIGYLADFLQDFISRKNIGRAGFIGHSLGAGIIIELCLRNPDMVDKLVLVGGLGFGRKMAMELRLLAIPYLGEQLNKPSYDGVKGFFHLLFENKELVTEEAVGSYLKIFSRPGAPQAYLAALRSCANLAGLKKEIVSKTFEHAGRIHAPTLILWGENDRIIPVEQAWIGEKLLPDARVYIFNNCGHMPQIECADEFNARVLDFLNA